ncbi:MAG: amidohydrolase family protein, partial [Kiritimatiellae bacterium]|nr:amidohydrolase family protein [Kiritimatiellia bacterium]
AGTIELIVREFGAERLIFGTGGKTHNGASLAGLAYADINPRARALIAHGNLDKLLHSAPARNVTRQPSLPDRRNKIWAKFMAGQKLPFDIVDAHFHLGLIGIWPLHFRDEAEQTDYALRRMARVNINKAVVSGEEALFSEPMAGNRALEKNAKIGGKRFAGYLGFNPYYDQAILSRLDEFFSGKFFIGFKVLGDYQGVPITDPRFKPVWDYANRHRLPILLHTWEGVNNSPRLLEKIAPNYPEATFLLGHSGGGNTGRREAIALAKANSNVFLEFCGSFCSDIPWEETIAEVGTDQIVFGTDGIYHDPAWELGRLVSLAIDEQTMAKFLAGNMRAILARHR